MTMGAAAPNGSRSGEGRSQPLVSVCMPARRDTGWFRSALDSALSQHNILLEVVVSDDSPGGVLRAIVQDIADPRVRYVPHPRPLGFALNHVAAIEHSSGEFIAFLHDDDEWDPHHLQHALAIFQEHPSVGLVLSGCDEIDAAGTWLRRRSTTMQPGVQKDALAQFLDDDVMLMLPSAAVFRRTALEANPRPWPDLPAADMTMFIDVARAGWDVFYVDRVLMRYRRHDAQVAGDQLVHRDAVVRIWAGYSFVSRRHERLRRRRVARDLLARAGELLRRGDVAGACSDLAAAGRTCWHAGLARALALRLLTVIPQLTMAADAVWKVLGRSRRRP